MQVKLSTIRIDGNTQSRVEINNEAVSEYAEALKGGVQFPPVDVFFDGADYWLVDGFHRYHAHRTAGVADIEANIHNGTLRDAQYYSSGANKSHGLRRTNADKRKSVEIALSVKPDSTDYAIANHCGVSNHFVSAIRNPEVKEKQQIAREKSVLSKDINTNNYGSDPVQPKNPVSKTSKPQPKQPEPQPEEELEEGLVNDEDIREIFDSQEKRIAELESIVSSLTKEDAGKEIYDLKCRIANEESQKLNYMKLLEKKSNENDAMYRLCVQVAKIYGVDSKLNIFALCKALFSKVKGAA